jgi:hypothetical protein
MSKNNKNLEKQYELTPVKNKPVQVSFSAEKISSDGGLLLLKEVENKIGIIKKISQCIKDERHPSYVEHSIESLVSQRVYQISAGYEDANDCDALKEDSVLKICTGKLTGTDSSLASQPTMSRFENHSTRKQLYDIAYAIAEHFVSSYSEEPAIIIIDCDDTSVTTYGEQQQIEFNNYYEEYCYMPLHIYEGLSGKLITTLLKPGRRSKNINTYGILKRLITFLRKSWKNTIIVVRGDGHFCCSELMDWAEGQKGVRFLTGLTGNSVLKKMSETTIKSAEQEYQQYGKPVKRYHSFEYQADTWKNSQRVIVKVEVSSMGTNIRYIVTDMREYRSKNLYEIGYCARGGMELRIKDHKLYLKSDRMSCNSFLANQMRLFLFSAAYILIHTLQKEILKGTEYANSTMETLKLKIIKVATRVKELKTKLKIEFPIEFPAKVIFEKCFGIFQLLKC